MVSVSCGSEFRNGEKDTPPRGALVSLVPVIEQSKVLMFLGPKAKLVVSMGNLTSVQIDEETGEYNSQIRTLLTNHHLRVQTDDTRATLVQLVDSLTVLNTTIVEVCHISYSPKEPLDTIASIPLEAEQLRRSFTQVVSSFN